MGFGFSARLKAALTASCMTLLLLTATPVQAGPVEDAIASANAGNNAKALEILEPLARRGHPDDWMQQDTDARIVFVMIADRFLTQLDNEGGDETGYQRTFDLAYDIAYNAASSENVVNWGMRFYLARMYLYRSGSTAEQEESAIALLQDVAGSGDRVYANLARTTLCDAWVFEYCDE